jgi:hypothetical protein
VNADRVSVDAPRALPLWRLIAGIAVFVSMFLVLAGLAPVYMDNYRFQQYLRSVAQAAPRQSATPDDRVKAEVLGRARALDLPVLADQIQITHPNGKLRLEISYAVQMRLGLYQVDLHFHPSAQTS